MKLKKWLRNLRYRLFAYEVKRRRPELAQPYFVRYWTSDDKVERDVFRPEKPLYTADDFTARPRWIIDAGANIGLRSIWFASLYPEATIVAIEPDRRNFHLLQKNAAFYPNIRCLQAGLWKTDAPLRISNPDDALWSFTVEELPPEQEASADFRGVTIESLMRDHGMDRIDILKLDIEGAEKDVFEHSKPWIDKVGTFLIEFHDRKKPGCTQAFFDAMKPFPYSVSERGDENMLVRPGSPEAAASPTVEGCGSGSLGVNII